MDRGSLLPLTLAASGFFKRAPTPEWRLTRPTLMSFTIRQASPEDAPTLVALILELADYERLSDQARPQEEALAKHLSPQTNPRCEALIAEDADSGQVAGMALYFCNYSTFLTQWGLFLEDLFVRPSFRGCGIGFALIQRLAELAVARGCERLDWNVLDWNDLAIDFYKQLGAEPLEEWTTMRLSGDALMRLGAAPQTPQAPS